MPKIFEWNGYRFYFFSNEGVPLEKIHIHVRKDKNVAKFFIEPDVYLESSWGMSSKELNLLEKQVSKNKEIIKRGWDDYFNKRSSSN